MTEQFQQVVGGADKFPLALHAPQTTEPKTIVGRVPLGQSALAWWVDHVWQCDLRWRLPAQFVHSDVVFGAFSLNPHGRSNELWNGMIDFNLAAPPKERAAALNLNLNCFVRLRPCRDIAEMALKVWKVTSPAVIYSRMPSGADAIGDKYAP
jgi:hypothetical protein